MYVVILVWIHRQYTYAPIRWSWVPVHRTQIVVIEVVLLRQRLPITTSNPMNHDHLLHGMSTILGKFPHVRLNRVAVLMFNKFSITHYIIRQSKKKPKLSTISCISCYIFHIWTLNFLNSFIALCRKYLSTKKKNIEQKSNNIVSIIYQTNQKINRNTCISIHFKWKTCFQFNCYIQCCMLFIGWLFIASFQWALFMLTKKKQPINDSQNFHHLYI